MRCERWCCWIVVDRFGLRQCRNQDLGILIVSMEEEVDTSFARRLLKEVVALVLR